jgi:hypothetical protein
MSSNFRRPLQLVELDVDFCDLTFGVGACTASGAAGTECFNTYATCQSKDDFDKDTLSLCFSQNQFTGIRNKIVFPALQSVSTNPTRISLGRSDQKLGSLGRRARVEVTLKDFRWSDRVTDPYVETRSYDPCEQGTFFGKLRARWPYYYGKALRVREGYVGDDPASMVTKNYIITDWSGPDDSGTVRITAQDPLKLTDTEFARCPAQSQGRLELDLAEGFAGDVTLVPEGVGDDYSSSGLVCIGQEVMAFTRSGDVLTITARAQEGTEGAGHDAGDTVQECYVAENSTVYDVARELLRDFAGVSDSFIPYSDWQTEVDEWLASLRLTRVIPKPVAVKDLLGEIADLGFIFWWDDRDQEIKLRTIRPPGYLESFETLDEDTAALEGSISRQDLSDERLSQVWYYHGKINVTENVGDANSYARVFVTVDSAAEGLNEYAQTKLIEIYQPWLGQTGDQSIVAAAANRLLDRYVDTPQRLTFQADIKDLDTLQIGELIEFRSQLLQSATGETETRQFIVTEREDIDPGNRMRVTLQSYQFRGRYAFIAPAATPDYDSATEDQRRDCIFIVDATTLRFPDGSDPYVIF